MSYQRKSKARDIFELIVGFFLALGLFVFVAGLILGRVIGL